MYFQFILQSVNLFCCVVIGFLYNRGEEINMAEVVPMSDRHQTDVKPSFRRRSDIGFLSKKQQKTRNCSITFIQETRVTIMMLIVKFHQYILGWHRSPLRSGIYCMSVSELMSQQLSPSFLWNLLMKF